MLLGSGGVATGQEHPSNVPEGIGGVESVESIETVSFCDLFQYPARYVGRTVKTTAVYVSDVERVAFVDMDCKSDAFANAVFSDSTRGTEKISKALRKHKLRPAPLMVTVVATFIDEYSGNLITVRPSQYSLKVKEVISATDYHAPSGKNSKH